MPNEEFMMAAIQAAPVPYDREASLDKAVTLIEEAGKLGATIAAFGEAWLPGFPLHVFQPPRASLPWKAAAQYLDNAVTIPSPTTDALCQAAKRAGVDVVIGIGELDPLTSGTVYCTLLFIGREGKILGRHRKLKPTFAERTVWGDGDSKGLRAYERPYGRISGLNCWEHNMVLPTYALAQQGTNIHVAAWPGQDYAPAQDEIQPHYTRQVLLSRAFASQTASYVIATSGVRTIEDIPEEFRSLNPVLHTGHSIIIDPRGEIVAGPVEGEQILTHVGSMETIRIAKAMCDIGGHYSRPDVFDFAVRGRDAN
jgi:nitrilase